MDDPIEPYKLYNDIIEFSIDFNEPLDDYYDIIDGMKYLGFKETEDDSYDHHFRTDSKYNHAITRLPSSLTHIYFGNDFNQIVNLPNRLTHLLFGEEFNTIITYPNTLTHLRFGKNFNQRLTLPENLTHLIFHSHSSYRHNIVLHDNITHLKYSGSYGKHTHLPNRLIYFSGRVKPHMTIPDTLVYLRCGNIQQVIDKLPNTLETLVLYGDIDLKFDNLPNSVKRMFIDVGYYDDDYYDDNRHDIYSKISMNKTIIFPNNLTHLALESSVIKAVLPSNLTHLTLGMDDQRKISHLKNLTQVTLDSWYNNIECRLECLPQNVRKVIFINQRIDKKTAKKYFAGKISSHYSSGQNDWLSAVKFVERDFDRMRMGKNEDLF